MKVTWSIILIVIGIAVLTESSWASEKMNGEPLIPTQKSKSAPPATTEKQKRQPTKLRVKTNDPIQEERGSHTNPLIVELHSSKAINESAKEESEKSFYDSLIAWSTIGLAGVTAVLVTFTGLLWWATFKLAKEALD